MNIINCIRAQTQYLQENECKASYRHRVKYTKHKSFCKTSFELRMDLKKDRNKAEMKEHKKTTYYINVCKKTRQMSGSLLVFFDLCLVSVLFKGPSLTELKINGNFFP